MKTMLHPTRTPEAETRTRILASARRLFAHQGFEGTTTRALARAAGVAEGTLFRHFDNKKAILVEVATQGWVELLTDLLTELSEMGSYKAVSQVIQRRLFHLRENADLMRVCFLEAQFHPELRDRIQEDAIAKMMDVAEAFVETGIERGIYRPMNPRLVAKVFLGIFAISGFSYQTLMEGNPSPEAMKEIADGLADIFLNGVLVKDA
ncbi:TetR/AcrR family transcriptional regulator [Geitlerinema sp. P-1104]|uniref:TetR/AcrR family transcriptional regulator n=1 Tax=Geitlerinema sp. P-1104 TaxID=2546230 RepID=UPI001477421C|nr:TetR/AcrR family transcriptional regulator [Geitlerinema sp. P-1104]NMG59350.1 TetR/AcrR family transcriptional regulator [Geitlerinema sp. P-1104]